MLPSSAPRKRRNTSLLSHNPLRFSFSAYLIKAQRQQRCYAGIFAKNFEIQSFPVEMMCDTTNRSFRTQLAAILEKLTKAALVEISNLADECSSVLHTEISLHKTENEALKKRCYSLEVQLRAAREAQTYPAHVNSVNRRHPAGQDGHTGRPHRPVGTRSPGCLSIVGIYPGKQGRLAPWWRVHPICIFSGTPGLHYDTLAAFSFNLVELSWAGVYK